MISRADFRIDCIQ